MLAVIYLLIT